MKTRKNEKIHCNNSMISTGFISQAQDAVKWNFTAKKIADKTYEIHLIPSVQSPWHIYSRMRLSLQLGFLCLLKEYGFSITKFRKFTRPWRNVA
jgi:hypothetical protein